MGRIIQVDLWGNKRKPKTRKIRHEKEITEQILFINWLKINGITFVNHSPNGGYRHPNEGRKFKLMGTSSGFPDIEIPWPSGKYHGFYLEFKTKNGVLSESQKNWLDYLRSKGYYAEVAFGFEDAKTQWENYFKTT